MSTIKYGSRGESVKTLQTLLGVTADGIFGRKTESALKEYQTTHGLVSDGICGRKTWTALGVVEQDIEIPCEDLKQFSSPHGNMTYGPDKSYSTYKSGGCGVTSFAIVYRALKLAPEGETGTQTIQRLGKYAWERSYRVKGNGTTSGLFNTNGCKRTSINSSKIEEKIRAGKLVILLIRKGFGNGYTGSGHYIVAYGIKGDYILLRDVGSSVASRQKVLLSKINAGLKAAWEVTAK